MNSQNIETNPPARIGRYRVVDRLGEGGMGTVYAAVDDTLGRRVALKLLRDQHRLDAGRAKRLLREAQVLSQIAHPGVCQLYEYVEGGDADCLVLELVPGSSLRDVMEDGLDRSEILRILAAMLDVLVAVHARGVIHRDLKPENVMLQPDGGVKLLDFGLARTEAITVTAGTDDSTPDRDEQMPDARQSGDADGESPLTSVGTVLGTIGYMSPEQARGEPATAASDMYSLGLIMQEMLTGRCPLSHDAPRAVRLQMAMWGETEPVRGLPADLTVLIERLTDLEPAARPAAVDAAAMLQRIRDRPRIRRRRFAVAAVVAVLAVFGAGMTVQYLRAETEAETARQVADFLQEVFAVTDPSASRGDAITARELLDRAADRIGHELDGQPVVQARLLDTMGMAYRGLGLSDHALPYALDALEMRRELLGGRHPRVAVSLRDLGTMHRMLGDLDEAERCYRESLDIAEELLPPEHPARRDIEELLRSVVDELPDRSAAAPRAGIS